MKLKQIPYNKRLFAAIIPKPVIDKSKCVKCGVCVKVCPVTPLVLNFDKKGKTLR
nr:4Fe-4S binding protein [Brachyspira hyodysenteriae]